MEYNHREIEKKWRQKWDTDKTYETSALPKKNKCYVLDMFPYPSGVAMHVGHPKGFIATDVFSRLKRMQGYDVLHPMGWDAFGLPAENYAIKNKTHPRKTVKQNVARYKSQLEMLGLDYDWEHEINTTDPSYYKWTQWIFTKLFEKGLARESCEPINWCPSCKTGLANEDLENGNCERCGSEVEQKPMRQWVLSITKYADRLLDGLQNLDWEPHIKEMQRNWIGKSEGCEVGFSVQGAGDKEIRIFTTRIDTLFGVTYVVLAPENELVEQLRGFIKNWDEVSRYKEMAKHKTELERKSENKEKTGVRLDGIMATNPANDEILPVFIADYVMMEYGTGAIMAVPAHDERDFAFAKKYNLPIKQSVAPYVRDNPKHDKKTEKRELIAAIIRNPKNNQYLCLNWKTTGWKSFVSGGIDGDSLEVAGQREAREETGYKHLRFVKTVGDSVYAEFYRPHKDSNVFAHFRYALFDLIDEEKEEINKKEIEQHEAIWIDEDEVGSFINVWNHRLAWKIHKNGYYANTDDGLLVNSGAFTGLTSAEAREKIIEWLEEKGLVKKKAHYKLRDWVFSRQRYWGEPIPIIHCEKCGPVAVPEKDLPVTLPEVESYEPTGTGESPLANMVGWVNTACPKCGGPGKRETNTMPQWAGSSWYYLRYIDPKNDSVLVDSIKEKVWMPVDCYVGGAEHATRHLIYARFWHKFLFDIGVVSTEEPFSRLQHVGLVLGEDGQKMSKRYGSAVNPDDIVEKLGADTFRTYEMFMGPFENEIAWSIDGMIGVRRFLERVARLEEKKKEEPASADLLRLTHETIKKVEEGIISFRFNTAISALMIFSRALDEHENVPHDVFEIFLKLLAPFAPHLAEELWQKSRTNSDKDADEREYVFHSIHKEAWPKYDENLMETNNKDIAVQINGRVRAILNLAMTTGEEEARRLVLSHSTVARWIAGKPLEKFIYVPGKIISIVLKP